MLVLTPAASRPRTAPSSPRRGHAAALGFASAPNEQPDTPLEVEGALPPWLRGRLVRATPALFDLEREGYQHWFDGLAKLCAFELRGDEASPRYRSRFVRSQAYAHAVRSGRIGDDNFGTAPRRGPLAAARMLFRGLNPTDNPDVNVARFGDRFVALGEVPRPAEFDPRTLETGTIGYREDFGGTLTSAHPLIDTRRGEVFNYETRFGPRSVYVVWALDVKSGRRRVVAELRTAKPSYLHSIGETRDHLVIAEFSLRVDPLALRFSLHALSQCLRWEPDDGMRVRVIRKDDGQVVADRRAEPCFAFHHTHAWETPEGVELCTVAWDSPPDLSALNLRALRGPSPPPALGTLVRHRIRWGEDDPGASFAKAEPLSDTQLEFPRMAPGAEAATTKYVYGITNRDGFHDELVKIDLRDGSARAYRREGHFFNEPVFVPRPGATAEDGGVVLTVALEPGRERSVLLVLDGEQLDERARLPLPDVIPFHFHGQFFPDAPSDPKRSDGD